MTAPRVTGILETCLYVDDLERARGFYTTVFGLCVLREDDRICAMAASRNDVLILFKRGASVREIALPGGTVPAHDGSGPLHFAFGIAAGDLDHWRQRLSGHNVTIESEVTWENGARSLYFRDLDGHLGELATPGLWALEAQPL